MSSSEYCKNQNHVSQKDFLKKELTDKYIIFNKKFTVFGMTPEENNEYFSKNNHAKSYYKYRDGLVRKINGGIASAVYRIAIKYNVNLIFMEDIDTKRSSYDSREENKIKDIFNFSKLKKELKQQAIKFHIPIVAVNPSETSIINHKNGLRGVEYYRYIVTLENGEISYIDRDDNAAENILDRGLSNHHNMRTFYAEQVEENVFRVVVDTKQKSGALYSRINSTSALFEKQDGILKVIKIDITKKDKDRKKINEKNVYITLYGNDWMLMHDVQNNLEEFSKSQKFIDWKSANL
jgi:IS605 OrfB family transposase